MKLSKPAAHAVFSFYFLSSAYAAETPPIVVSASSVPTSVTDVGSSVSVIDREEIELKGEQNVLELLRSVPGLSVVRSGGLGKVSSVFIRGAEADHTLVLIDGVRANDINVGGFDFADLNTANIERIEVVRGPQSVLYGSDAIGGVINIITREAEDGPHGEVSAAGGTHSTQQYRARAAWGGGSFSTSNALSYLDSEGVSAASESAGNSEDDGYENFTASSRIGGKLGEDGQADLTARFISAESEIDGFEFGVGPVDDLNYTQKRRAFAGGFSAAKPVTDWLLPRLEIGVYDEDLKGRDPDTEFNNFDVSQTTTSATAAADVSAFEQDTVSLGYTYERREGENTGNFDEQRDVHAIFLQNQLHWPAWALLTAGVRYEDDSDFGDETTLRATASLRPPETPFRVHSSIGTGYKAPSFNELYFPNFGNPDLDAETSVGFDFGLEYSASENLTIDAVYFHNKIDDLITFDSATFLAQNIEQATIQGLELTVDSEVSEQIRVVGQYTLTDSENEQTGAQLARRPKHSGSLDIFFSPDDKLRGSLTLIVIRDRVDSDGAKMDNYERVDASIKYSLLENIVPFVQVENLFDEDYEEITGFTTPGFEILAGVELAL